MYFFFYFEFLLVLWQDKFCPQDFSIACIFYFILFYSILILCYATTNAIIAIGSLTIKKHSLVVCMEDGGIIMLRFRPTCGSWRRVSGWPTPTLPSSHPSDRSSGTLLRCGTLQISAEGQTVSQQEDVDCLTSSVRWHLTQSLSWCNMARWESWALHQSRALSQDSFDLLKK